MPYAEYPKTNYYDSDLGELIGFYKKVTAEYATTLELITDVNNRLIKYQSTLPQYVQSLMTDAISQYVRDCENMGKKLTLAVEQVKASVVEEASRRELADEKLLTEIRSVSLKLNDTEKEFDRRISEMRLMILASNSSNRKMVDETVDYCRKLVEELPKSTYPIENHIRGELSTVDDAVADLYNYGITSCGFSAGQWHTKTHITAEFFKDSNVTCLDFWTHGRTILDTFSRQAMTFSPVTGQYVTVEKALKDLANYVKEYGITAGKYDSKEITAEEYDGKDLTAGNYDFNGKGELTDV